MLNISLRFVVVVFVAIALTGCATGPTRSEMLQSWVGHDVNELIVKWGPPSSDYVMPNGNRMYTWFVNAGAVAMPLYGGAVAVPRSCKTTFTADFGGIIRTWSYEGNACGR